MWIVYALLASMIWGISYAASGRVIERGMTPLVFFFYYALFSALAAALGLGISGRLGTVTEEFHKLGPDRFWFGIAVAASAAGALLIYMAIGEKNATLASLIEISYPFFVAVFAWIFFRDIQFNLFAVTGGALILAGVGIIFLGNRN